MPGVVTLPAGVPFVEALAAGLLAEADGRPDALADALVLLPTRRACRLLAEAFVRQSGGRGQYGHVVLTVEPAESGKGLEFVNKIVGGAIPREYIPAVEKGVKERMESGVVAGYPLRDVRVTLIDGSYHDVDSNEMAFKIAGSIGFADACKKADPVLLEPIMKVEVLVPQEFMGDVIGNLNGRRGKIQGMKVRAGSQAIEAAVQRAT